MTIHTTLLYGDAGTGKSTAAIKSSILAGQQIRFLALENNAIVAAERVRREMPDLLEGQLVISQPERDKMEIGNFVKNVGLSLNKTLKDLKTEPDIKKKNYKHFHKSLQMLASFKDYQTGQSYGSIETWGDETTLVIDGLTRLSEIIVAHNIGGKLALNQSDFGVSQGLLKSTIRLITENIKCNLIIIAHPKSETTAHGSSETGSKIYPSTLGVALDNWTTTAFSDVIWASRKAGAAFTWNNDHKRAITRAGVLKISDNMKQDFAQMFTKEQMAEWKTIVPEEGVLVADTVAVAEVSTGVGRAIPNKWK